jgi:hypothetical protein
MYASKIIEVPNNFLVTSSEDIVHTELIKGGIDLHDHLIFL